MITTREEVIFQCYLKIGIFLPDPEISIDKNGNWVCLEFGYDYINLTSDSNSRCVYDHIIINSHDRRSYVYNINKVTFKYS